MATLSSLAIRQEDAFKRIEAELGVNLHDFYHRDPAVMETLRIEAIADALGGKAAEATAIPDEAVGAATVETVEVVDTGKTDAKTVTNRSPHGYGGAPIAGYDDMSVGDILEKARGLDNAGRAKILAYERANKKRTGVITALVGWNS